MRIKSTFRDYYDSVQATGQDQSLLYLRQPKEIVLPNCPFAFINELRHWTMNLVRHYYVVGFCGKIYPILEVQRLINHQPVDTAFCLNVADVDAFVERNFQPKTVELYHSKSKKWTLGWSHSRHHDYEKYFQATLAERDKHQQLFLNNQCPIFIYHQRQGQHILEANGELKKLCFFRLFDTFTAFQEISMYLGGMASPEKPIPKIDDKTMAEIKGFDKWSFRKEPKQ